VQIAKARGAHVIGTASAAKHDLLRGGEHGARSAGLLVPGGLLISALGGNPGFGAEQAAELGIRFEIVSVRPSAGDLGELLALVESGRLKVLVEETVPLADVAKAHELVEDGHVTGKVVLIS